MNCLVCIRATNANIHVQVPGTRSRQANDARQATMQRSAAIRKIEQDMIQLGQLYQEVAELVHQQEPAVTQIEQSAEQTHGHVQQANTKLDSAITSARNARRWKWYALIIIRKCCLRPVLQLDFPLTMSSTVIIIGIVVGVAVGVTQANKAASGGGQ